MSIKELIELNKSVKNKNYRRRIKNIILTNYYNNDEAIKNLITIATTDFNTDLKDELFNYYVSELNRENYYYRRHRNELRISENYSTVSKDLSQEEIYMSLKLYEDMRFYDEERQRALELREVIDLLEPEEQELINKLYFDGLTTRELAKEMDVHQTQILRKRNKILEKMQKMIKK